MSYVVLARKWRPQFFEEVVGQQHVARTLINSIEQDRVAHAYLFTGARGVGKTSTARILAKALNCHKGPTAKPCYDCPSCHEISRGQAVDVFEIDGASNRGINEIRDLREGVRYAPSRDRFKIYIIDEVHMLTTEAFNALLKTLEEPPPHVKFIFATTEPQKIPVTILSRCQRFDFKRVSQHDIVEHLVDLSAKEHIDVERDALQLIARQANGGMRDALSLLDQVISFADGTLTEEQVTQILGVANRKHLFDLSAAIAARAPEGALELLDEIDRYGYDLQQFAGEMVHHVRDMMAVKVAKNPARITQLTERELELIRQQIEEMSEEFIHRMFTITVNAAEEMSRSAYPKMLFEMMLVRLCRLEPLVSVDLLIDRLHQLEGVLGEEHELAPDERDAKKKTPLTPEPRHAAPPPASDVAAAPSPQAPPERKPEPKEGPPEPPPWFDEDISASAHDLYAEELVSTYEVDEPTDDLEPAHDEDDFDQDIIEHASPTLPTERMLDDAGVDEDVDLSKNLPSIDLDQMDAQLAWKMIVDHLRVASAPLAATLERAHVDALTTRSTHLSFIASFLHFLHDEERIEPLRQVLRALFGPEHGLVLELRERDDSEPGQETLAQLRELARRKREEDLVVFTREHPIVQHVHGIFGGELKMRVRVRLREDSG
ncbi:MAG: DNA polymerase III subunit gamma/tau [Myxococcota bacterium]